VVDGLLSEISLFRILNVPLSCVFSPVGGAYWFRFQDFSQTPIKDAFPDLGLITYPVMCKIKIFN
jgi:hypothetical protein